MVTGGAVRTPDHRHVRAIVGGPPAPPIAHPARILRRLLFAAVRIEVRRRMLRSVPERSLGRLHRLRLHDSACLRLRAREQRAHHRRAEEDPTLGHDVLDSSIASHIPATTRSAASLLALSCTHRSIRAGWRPRRSRPAPACRAECSRATPSRALRYARMISSSSASSAADRFTLTAAPTIVARCARLLVSVSEVEARSSGRPCFSSRPCQSSDAHPIHD